MGHNRAIIITLGAILAALIVLFPEWKAVHPSDPTLTVSVGHAWILSPPPPPKGYERVEHSNLGYGMALIVLIATGVFYWLEGRGKSDR